MAELYAIVGDMERARFMLEGGAPYLQLRFKALPLAPRREEIAAWPARYPHTRLIVNDDLDFALAVGAWGVHLGQEDLRRYDGERLRQAPIQVGISTHDDGEIATALDAGAAMIGFGPVFPTETKALIHEPQGLERLAEISRSISCPVVAIGGIEGENLAGVVATGVGLIAMIGYLHRIETHAALRDLMDRMGDGPGNCASSSH